MGGAVSPGENNDDLIDNLVQENYITSDKIEEIFRAVDRGNYYLPGHKDSAYHDLAWRHENFHISAPCIYSKVLCSLKLKPGLSFLNIGSGTGYLSTMAGLLLGICGVNHGIELHQDVVDYARIKVQEFVSESRSFDKYTFCEPEFVTGNCLDISPDVPGYDRVYCGAACPDEYESFMKNLLNINGLLIMPFNDQLQVITRTGQTSWETENILVVNFASLVVPPKDVKPVFTSLPIRLPPSLSALCRANIRQVLSSKFHKGSNRRFAKRKSIDKSSSDEEFCWRLRGGASLDEGLFSLRLERTSRDSMLSQRRRRFGHSRMSDGDRPASGRRPPRSGAILNIVTSTLTTVASEEDSSVTTNASEQPSTSSGLGGATSDNSFKDRDRQKQDDDQPSTRKSFLRRKSRKKKNSNSTETDETAKRPKKGWALIRERIRNRFTDKPKITEAGACSSSAGASSSTSILAEQRTEQSSEEQSGVPLMVVSTNDAAALSSSRQNENSDVMPPTARSLFFSMTAHSSSDAQSDMERRLQRNLISFLNARRSLRNSAPSNPPQNDSDSETKSSDQMEEIPLPPNDFQSAILELPLPHSVKSFLLFYRTPN